MIIIEKGIILIMGTDDVNKCHWIKAIMDEIEYKKADVGIYDGKNDSELGNEIVST